MGKSAGIRRGRRHGRGGEASDAHPQSGYGRYRRGRCAWEGAAEAVPAQIGGRRGVLYRTRRLRRQGARLHSGHSRRCKQGETDRWTDITNEGSRAGVRFERSPFWRYMTFFAVSAAIVGGAWIGVTTMHLQNHDTEHITIHQQGPSNALPQSSFLVNGNTISGKLNTPCSDGWLLIVTVHE